MVVLNWYQCILIQFIQRERRSLLRTDPFKVSCVEELRLLTKVSNKEVTMDIYS